MLNAQKDKQMPYLTASFQDNLDKPAAERYLDFNEARDDVLWWQWHHLDHM